MDETRIALARETLRHWTSMVRSQDFHPPLPCEDALAIMVKAYDELKAEKPSLSRIENKISEIQSAEEFAMVALDIYSDEVAPEDKHNIEVLANRIRARDKAIVERIHARLGLIIMPDTMIGAFYSKAIDDVLRELGGEQ